jgi:hypothetical protein
VDPYFDPRPDFEPRRRMPAWARILIIVVCVAAVGSMHLIAWIAYSTRSHEPYFPPRHVITPAIAFDGQGNQITVLPRTFRR